VTRRGGTALTPREHDVLDLLQTWLTTREIGERLHVSTNTVRSHTYAIYRKLGVSSRREAVARARARGIITR
jgi:LuxR family maltose regulon positive regulatory protein